MATYFFETLTADRPMTFDQAIDVLVIDAGTVTEREIAFGPGADVVVVVADDPRGRLCDLLPLHAGGDTIVGLLEEPRRPWPDEQPWRRPGRRRRR